MFEHLLRLDHSFHLKRNTGAGRRLAGVAGSGREPSACMWHCPVLAELRHTDWLRLLPTPAGKVMRILDRGTSSIQDVMQASWWLRVLGQLRPRLSACCWLTHIPGLPWWQHALPSCLNTSPPAALPPTHLLAAQVVLFSLLPQLVDVLVACSYMALKLQPWTAVVVGCTGAARMGCRPVWRCGGSTS